ncbi:MAG: hypothetical protein EHM79_06030 [Geobacter sp.]|nr:MAG: hypothetical protein EHM79_06030 [Geobacter sp.]
MKTAVVAVVKNEIDIIDVFLDHVVSCFDFVYLCDNFSSDGTYEKLLEKATHTDKIRLFRLKSKSFIQSALVSFLVNTCFSLEDPDVIFMLDADEFLPFPDAASLKVCLKLLDTELIYMHWDNMVLDHEGRLVTAPPYRSKISKVAIFRAVKKKFGRIRVDNGNHNIKRSRRLQSVISSFPLLHMPIRSEAQLMKKLIIGNVALIMNRDNIGFHLKMLGEYCFDNIPRIDEIALKYALRYGENIDLNEILATDLNSLQRIGGEVAWLESLLATKVTILQNDCYKQIFDAVMHCNRVTSGKQDGILYDVAGNIVNVFTTSFITRIRQL